MNKQELLMSAIIVMGLVSSIGYEFQRISVIGSDYWLAGIVSAFIGIVLLFLFLMGIRAIIEEKRKEAARCGKPVRKRI